MDKINVEGILKSREDFKPFSDYTDRVSWEGISEEIKKDYISKAKEYLGYKWPSLTATAYMDFSRTGSRQSYDSVFFERKNIIKQLLLAECMEGKGRFVNDIISGVWLLCEQSTWVIPAHDMYLRGKQYRVLPDVEDEVIIIDLFSAETASLLAWVGYFLKDNLDEQSPLIYKRIQYEINKRVIEPFLKFDHFFWMGFNKDSIVNNWNPWILSNILTTFLILEEDSKRRITGVIKCIKVLDNFIAEYPPDGGCYEGAHYWNEGCASMFDCLELLFEGTGGRFNVYGEPLIKNIGRYIHRAHIAGHYYVNYGDGEPRIESFYELISRYGRRIGDTTLEHFGSAMFTASERKESGMWHMYRELTELFNDASERKRGTDAQPPTAGDVWLEDLQFMAFREIPESYQGFYLAAIGGNNGVSHGHNDIGSFIVYYNGMPILIDPGVETYTAKTFSASRSEIWTMQSSYHNLPEINRFMQKEGKPYHASDVKYEASDKTVKLSLDLAGAYPVEAGIEKWIRTIKLNRQENTEIIIEEDFELKEASDNIILNLITTQDYKLENHGQIVLKGDDGSEVIISYDHSVLQAEVQTIELTDPKIRKDWGKDRMYRVQLRTISPLKTGHLYIRLGAKNL